MDGFIFLNQVRVWETGSATSTISRLGESRGLYTGAGSYKTARARLAVHCENITQAHSVTQALVDIITLDACGVGGSRCDGANLTALLWEFCLVWRDWRLHLGPSHLFPPSTLPAEAIAVVSAGLTSDQRVNQTQDWNQQLPRPPSVWVAGA